VAASFALHVLVFYAAGSIDPPEDDAYQLTEFEIAQEPPKPEPPKPKPEPPKPKPEPPKPEPPKPDEPEERKVQPKVRPNKPPPPPKSDPAPPAAPKKFRLPPSQTVPGQGDGPMVDNGEPNDGGFDPRGKDDGDPDGKPKGTGNKPGGPDPKATGPGKPTEKPWKPASELYIRQLPKLSKRPPKLQCAATRNGVTGTVVLKVQVRKDGTLRSVKVAKGIGSGCDEVAVSALKKAKFSAAIATDGKPADYELRYEYVFKPAD
jgi:TonB family protein